MKNISIIKIENDYKKSEICRKILLALPQWFGIAEATDEYIKGVKGKLFLVAKMDEEIVGFYSITSHFPQTSEIYVCGVLAKHHRKGVGKLLQTATEDILRSGNVKMLTVKTLSTAHPDKGYAKTREFYSSMGFIPMEEFTDLWGEDNPCLFLVKVL